MSADMTIVVVLGVVVVALTAAVVVLVREVVGRRATAAGAPSSALKRVPMPKIRPRPELAKPVLPPTSSPPSKAGGVQVPAPVRVPKVNRYGELEDA